MLEAKDNRGSSKQLYYYRRYRFFAHRRLPMGKIKILSVSSGVPGRSLADLSDCKESDMLIARSACSCGLPCRATEHGQPAGFQPIGSEAKVRRTHRTTKARALTTVNPIRPRYTNLAAANLPEMVKPATDGQVTSVSTRQAARGDWGERVPKDQSRNLGGPAQCPRRAAFSGNQ